ncbi:unnamed protein product [Coregonus sp. 'balchen']|nr:unnamed protein product [Coregonus sp. 'balchen']
MKESDGRKVLRSSIREFLCSEAMAALGIPTTRAASLVTSDLYVNRDPLNNGQVFGGPAHRPLLHQSQDEFSGRQGPSPGRHDIRAQLVDYIIDTFYPDIQRNHSNRKERNTEFFKEVWTTLKLQFQHSTQSFLCNASDRRGRYSYQAQPSVCRWNLARLAETLGSELHASQAGAILDEFMPLYETLYLANMRRKLGLLRWKEPEDQELVSELLRLMHNTDRPEVAHQLEKMSRLKELLSTNQDELRAKQREDWLRWVSQYREVCTIEEERIRVMDSTNPRVVLRNYIAQNAIQAAENGDFSEVRRVLKVLENPFSAQPESELPGGPKTFGERDEKGMEKDKEGRKDEGRTAGNQNGVPYDSKPPVWAREICVT